MPPRRPANLVILPSRPRSATLSVRNLLQIRSQSTCESAPPPSSSRPSFSRGAKLASFAAEGDILTTPHKSAPKPLQPAQNLQPPTTPSKPLAYPRPVLKSNRYANNYTVSEADLQEPGELEGLSSIADAKQIVQDAASSSSRPTDTKYLSYSKTRKGGRVKSIRRRTKPILPLTDSELVYNTIDLGNEETVQIHDGYIVFNTKKIRNGVITFGRLRDSCTCKICRDSSTSQKTFTTGQAMREAYGGSKPIIEKEDLNHYITNPISNSNSNSNSGGGGGSNKYKSPTKGLKIIWRDLNGEKLHTSFISRFKLKLLTDTNLENEHHFPTQSFIRKLWDSKQISQINTLKIPFEQVESQNPKVMLSLLEQLHIYGLVIIEGVPTNPTDDQNCYLRKVMGYIGEIRNTFYGETWDVKSMKQSKNVAYTNLDLGLHMDLLYFSSPPRFQSLHCLRNRVNGGSSYFVDSFKVASELPEELFQNLQSVRIPYIYNNDNHFLRHSHNVITHKDLISNLNGSINWSPPFRDSKGSLNSIETLNKYNQTYLHELRSKLEFSTFQAISEFEKALGDQKYKFEFMLKEGDLVMFDNRRILHARTAFQDKSEQERIDQGLEFVEGEPTRWLKGCYLDGEVVWDKLAVLRKMVDKEIWDAGKSQ